MTEQRVVTAFHEAGHAVVACAVGQMILEISIKPTVASAHYPGSPASLGHMLRWKHPAPRPIDAWLGSFWTETQCLVGLAGYLVEDILFPNEDYWNDHRREPGADHQRVVSLMRVVAPKQVERAAQQLRRLRLKCLEILELPGQIELVETVAEDLLAEEVITGEAFYQRYMNGRCGALHKEEAPRRCDSRPHRYGPHWFDSNLPNFGELEFQEGLEPPDPRLKVTDLPGNLKRLRALVGGGPGPHLTDEWKFLLDICDDLPLEQ